MRTKVQKEFQRQRKAYERELQRKANEDNLSLEEKLEWQQLSRNRYRESLFRNLDSDSIRNSFYLPGFDQIPIIVLMVGGLIIFGIIKTIGGLFIEPKSSTSQYADFSYDVIQEGKSTHVIDSSYNEVYHAILETSDQGNYLYDIYNESQTNYDTSQIFDIHALYEIETFYYEKYDFLRDSLYSDLDNLQTSILTLAKAQYSNSPITSSDLETMKTAIETAKTNFDEEITFAIADLMKNTLDERN